MLKKKKRCRWFNSNEETWNKLHEERCIVLLKLKENESFINPQRKKKQVGKF